MILLKSKLYREEIKHWLLIFSIFSWAFVASFFAFRNTQKTLVIGIDEAGSRIISDSKDRLIQVELKQFFKYFLDQYYTYNQETFNERLGLATELMSPELWDREKSKLLDLKAKLDKIPLSQFSELENIDLVDQNKVEATLKIKIKSRLNDQNIRLKVILNFKKQERSESNPWNFQITELSDVVI
ncbi:MAG: hypothetical protein WA160_16115 [Pseudobdellovibrio sp.]